MDIEISLSKIYILESLFETDLKTGTELYSDVIRWNLHNEKRIEFEVLEIRNFIHFGEAMSRIMLEVDGGVSPLIHFEMHGSEKYGRPYFEIG